MKAKIAFAITLVCSTSICLAGETGENDKGSALTSYQLGDYSLGLDTDDPDKPNSADPPAMVTLRQETVRPFVGFKFSGPLPNLGSLGQASQDVPTPNQQKVSKSKVVSPKTESVR